MAPYKVTYFNITALAEPLRFLFSYGGLEFEDVRIEKDEWPALKPKTPYGQLPILEYDGKVAHQSVAMARYLAKKVKLVGNDDWEDLEIDAIIDTITDFRINIAKYHYDTDEKHKEKLGEVLFNQTLPHYIKKLDEQAAKNNGYLVLGRLTWADLFFVALLDYLNFMAKQDILANAPNLQAVRKNVHEVPTIKEYLAKRPKTDI